MTQTVLASIPEERAEKLRAADEPLSYIEKYRQDLLSNVEPRNRAVLVEAIDCLAQTDFNHPGENYLLHPIRVAWLQQRAFPTSTTIDATLLALFHNHLEVSEMPPLMLEQLTGRQVREWCELLTLDRAKAKTDPEYLGQYYARLSMAAEEPRRVKVIDKLDNLLTLYKQPSETRRNSYFAEIRGFVAPLALTFSRPLAEYLECLIQDNLLLAVRSN